MNTHDIELPPLPPLYIAPSVEPVDYPEVAQALMDYARAAIEADRQRRCEPVAWIQRSYLNLIRESNVALHNVVVRGSILDGDGDVVPLFTAPQPAEPSHTPTDTKQRIYDLAQEAGAARYTSLSETKIDSLCFDPASFERFCERLLEMETT